ncbi:MAG TPA: hypothetical protein V6C65_38815 [Allocoleopsis sp.]
MASTNTASTLTAYLKEVYPEGLPTVCSPRKTPFLDRFKFSPDLEMGKKAVIALQVTDEHGFATKDGAGSLTLATSIAHEGVAYEVGPYQMAGRFRVSYDLAAQASSSKKSFGTWNQKGFIPKLESAQKKLEIVCMHGRDGIGEVDSTGSGYVILKAGSWAPFIWQGAKNMEIDIFSAKTGGTQRNSTALVITQVNSNTRRIDFTGTNSGIQQGDIIFLRNFRGQEAYGVFGLANASIAGSTVYNVAHTYETLQASSYDCGTSELSFSKLLEAAALSMDKGCDEKLITMIPGKAFAHLVNQQSNLRKHGAELNVKNGAKSLVFSLGDIDMELVPSGFVKRGQFIMLPERYVSRVGSTDFTMVMPGKSDEELVTQVADETAYEMRLYTAQTVVIEQMAWVVVGSRSDGGEL